MLINEVIYNTFHYEAYNILWEAALGDINDTQIPERRVVCSGHVCGGVCVVQGNASPRATGGPGKSTEAPWLP